MDHCALNADPACPTPPCHSLEALLPCKRFEVEAVGSTRGPHLAPPGSSGHALTKVRCRADEKKAYVEFILLEELVTFAPDECWHRQYGTNCQRKPPLVTGHPQSTIRFCVRRPKIGWDFWATQARSHDEHKVDLF